jgi:hypothetical protein
LKQKKQKKKGKKKKEQKNSAHLGLQGIFAAPPVVVARISPRVDETSGQHSAPSQQNDF